MSDHRADGGPAFPQYANNTRKGMDGMTLRDWFAGQALAGMIAGGQNTGSTTDGDAKSAYVYADSMLAEREG